jgi:hypothetical protein
MFALRGFENFSAQGEKIVLAVGLPIALAQETDETSAAAHPLGEERASATSQESTTSRESI